MKCKNERRGFIGSSKQLLGWVSAKTPKYCGHYKYFFLVITITEL